jgi:transposase
MDLENFFKKPQSPRQKQYEAVRAFALEQISVEEIARRFSYKVATVYSLIRDAKAGRLDLFPHVQPGPKSRKTDPATQQKIIDLRKRHLSVADIVNTLKEDEVDLSLRTIERIITEAGFQKLQRRTRSQRGLTKRGTIIPPRSEPINLATQEPFAVDCPIAGLFFFIPYILETRLLDVVEKCQLPASSSLGAHHAALSMMAYKLMGHKRLSTLGQYDQDPGLGLFAGLTVLPKATYMCSYSCRTSEEVVYTFQDEVVSQLRHSYPHLYPGRCINLDFHTIPHFGTEKTMERVWSGTRGKAVKGANTLFAQDNQSNVILYSRADILRKEESSEIKRFITYWKTLKQRDVDEILVFDSKFTTYTILDYLTDEGIQFITLRRRGQTMVKHSLTIPQKEWTRIKLNIPKRKHTHVSVIETNVTLKDCHHQIRQIIIKDHGRAQPTFIITNTDIALKEVLEIYAKRWRIENKLAELITFFNLNALSSPLMIRIHFDILWTIIADTIYRIFAQDLRRFENHEAQTLFRRFINMPGKVVWTGSMIQIRIRKRSHTPLLMGLQKLKKPFRVPWLDNYPMEIIWTA